MGRMASALLRANYSGTYSNGPLDKGNGAFAGPGSHPLSLAKFPDPHSLILLCEVQNSTAPEFNIDDSVRFGPSQTNPRSSSLRWRQLLTGGRP